MALLANGIAATAILLLLAAFIAFRPRGEGGKSKMMASFLAWLQRGGDGGSDAEEALQARIREMESAMAVRAADLQESEARLQGFIRNAPAAIAFQDLQGRMVLFNQRAEALLGLCPALTPGTSLERIFPDDVVARAREQDGRVLVRRESVQMEEEVVLADRALRDLLVQKFPLIDAVGHLWGLGVIATDITERKRSELVHHQRQKVESIAILAGGLAHDFNNLLGAMIGNLELARIESDPWGPATPHIREQEALIARASAMVAQLLAYAGTGKRQIHKLDLNLQVEGIIRLMQSSLSRTVALQWEPAPGLPSMEGDLTRIPEVIMNVVLNATEAVDPKKGAIWIRTGMETLTPQAIEGSYACQGLAPGPFLTLEVSDNGHGMSPEVQARIFDPYFTTRSTGRGLGLAVVHGVLLDHHGGIQVISAVGKGASFKLLFPATVAEDQIQIGPVLGPDPQVREYKGAGTVLVVDDESLLRAVAVGVLRRLGFDTLEAGDGLEALQVFEAQKDRIRLILLDLTMPRLNGVETYRELRRAGALAPIILTSGYSEEEALSRFQGRALAGFLQKPYRFQTLVNTVRDALGGEGGTLKLRGMPPREVVAWIPEFNTGHPLIDAQHQELVEAFNLLVASTENPRGGEDGPEAAIARLVEMTAAHFQAEEELMEAHGYPSTEEHRAVHTLLMGRVRELVKTVLDGGGTFNADMLNFLEDWVLCHMLLEDQDLGYFLKDLGPVGRE